MKRSPLPLPTSPLRRTAPLSSRALLSPGSGPKRKVPMPRGKSGMEEGTGGASKPVPAPRRRPVTPQERRTRAVVQERSGGRCERCGAVATNMSHRKPVSQGGRWEPANVTHLCGAGNVSGCHGWCHGSPVEANSLGWVLKSWQDAAVEPVTFPDGRRLIPTDDGGWVERADLA